MKLIRYNTEPTYLPAFSHRSLLGELDRLFEVGFPSGTPHAFPVDIHQKGDAVSLRAELPGFRKENLQVSVADDVLTIAGQVTTEAGEKDGPRTETTVERRIALPKDLAYDKISAAYENGVLTVTLPKREEAKPATVAIEVK